MKAWNMVKGLTHRARMRPHAHQGVRKLSHRQPSPGLLDCCERWLWLMRGDHVSCLPDLGELNI